MLIVVAIIWWARWADFVPSFEMRSFSLYGSILIGGVATITVFRRIGHKFIGPDEKSKTIQWLFVILLPALMIFFSLAVIGHGVPAAYTAIAGLKYSESVKLEKQWSHGRFTCNYRLTGKSIETALPGYICITEDMFELLPGGELIFDLIGKKSWAGKLYLEVRLVSPANKRVKNDAQKSARVLP
ncbi:MAG: hypothetical protein PVG66_02115 [Chromatiales bacterium]